jgi:hypothetical protein
MRFKCKKVISAWRRGRIEATAPLWRIPNPDARRCFDCCRVCAAPRRVAGWRQWRVFFARSAPRGRVATVARVGRASRKYTRIYVAKLPRGSAGCRTLSSARPVKAPSRVPAVRGNVGTLPCASGAFLFPILRLKDVFGRAGLRFFFHRRKSVAEHGQRRKPDGGLPDAP